MSHQPVHQPVHQLVHPATMLVGRIQSVIRDAVAADCNNRDDLADQILALADKDRLTPAEHEFLLHLGVRCLTSVMAPIVSDQGIPEI